MDIIQRSDCVWHGVDAVSAARSTTKLYTVSQDGTRIWPFFVSVLLLEVISGYR